MYPYQQHPPDAHREQRHRNAVGIGRTGENEDNYNSIKSITMKILKNISKTFTSAIILLLVATATSFALPSGTYTFECCDGKITIYNSSGSQVGRVTNTVNICGELDEWKMKVVVEGVDGINPDDNYTGSAGDPDHPIWEYINPQELAEGVINYTEASGDPITPPTQDDLDDMVTLHIKLDSGIE